LDHLEFRVLGPVEVRLDGQPVRVVGKALTVLAGLLLSANETVTPDTIADWVWTDGLPVHPRAALHNTLSRLRHLFGPDMIETAAGGYRLVADEEQLDLLRFQRLSLAATAALRDGAAGDAADLLSEALDLWREPLLANVDSPALMQDLAGRLNELYLNTHEIRAQVCLRLGQHTIVTDSLPAIVRAHPFRESLAESLMLALLAGDRRAEALAVYELVRRALRDELGIDPGVRLQDLHQQILREPSLAQAL
jgi:DNA-binding SARP family transcriptional activator